MQTKWSPRPGLSRRRVITLGVLACLAFVIMGPRPGLASENAALWQKLGDGSHFAMIRHALAPGVGDPGEFKLRDCTTQRNLNDEGRAQARHIGALFQTNGIAAAKVYSSQWCRCLDTARLMALGDVTEMPAVNSFYQRYENREKQLAAFNTWLSNADLSTPTVLVTHQVVISAVTNGFASSGEIVIVRRISDAGIEVVGRIETR